MNDNFKWQKPYKEIDTSKLVPAGTFVYITAANNIVTSGLTDLVAGSNKKSLEGFWQAAVNVPAASGGSYNVPQFPYPGVAGTVTGSAGSVKGDLDTSGIFWIYWGKINVCT